MVFFKLNKDPVKNVRPACSFCGKTNHSESSCCHNEGATCPIAIRRAPFGTPLFHKHNPSGSQPPPRNGGRRKSSNPSSARALAASSSTRSDRECEQALADTLGRCGLLAEDCGGRALMAVAASTPAHPAALSHSGAAGRLPNHRLIRPFPQLYLPKLKLISAERLL